VTLATLREACRAIDAEQIAERATRFLEVWSPPGGEAEFAQLVRASLMEAGAQDVVLDEEFDGSPSVIGWLRGPSPGPTIQWHAHLDAISTPHAPVRREGDLIYGRGAADMKGAIAAMVESIRLLRAAGLPEQGQVLITYHGMHEEGRSVPLVRLIERGFVGDAVLIGELGSGDQLITSSRGLTFWEFKIAGSDDSIHETNAPSEVINPLTVGLQLVDRLRALASGLDGGSVAPRGALYIGKFVSGDYYNRIPTSCVIAGTRRHEADGSLEQVRDELLAIAADIERTTGATVEAQIQDMFEAYEIDPNVSIATALREAHFEMTGQAMVPGASGASGNAVDFVLRAGVPAVYYGCDYASAHSDHERLSVQELARIAAVFALTSVLFLEGSGADQVATASPAPHDERTQSAAASAVQP